MINIDYRNLHSSYLQDQIVINYLVLERIKYINEEVEKMKIYHKKIELAYLELKRRKHENIRQISKPRKG